MLRKSWLIATAAAIAAVATAVVISEKKQTRLGLSGRLPVPLEEARRVLDAPGTPGRADVPRDSETDWQRWLADHDRAVRARIDRGNEDSLYYFWLYGTSFSARPRATQTALASLTQEEAVALLEGRLNDLLSALTNPGDNTRLAFARALIERNGIDISSPQGRDAARDFFVNVRNRVITENRQLARVSAAASSIADDARRDLVFGTMLSARGLSSDTSLVVNFTVMEAIRRLAGRSHLAPRSIRRVAVIGPGLDFTDKADGYDFYPEQSMQPFAVIDALGQLGLLADDGFELVAMDLNPRIVRHFEDARRLAADGHGYILHLPFDHASYADSRAEFVTYWKTAGMTIGDAVKPGPLPAGVPVDLRVLAVRPDVVRSIVSRDLNIVTERLADAEAFDLIIATNLLVYYDRFEQGLALSNIAAMMKPGGFFLTNSAVTSPTTLRFLPAASGPVAIAGDEADQAYWFRRE